ncbi:DUF2235 domain-containing protein [Rhodobacterales bacterium HKCCE3408]|nr:DUF2235 domain-containing protein [Rhodobacterales bacterium HKCCE3408]
MLLDGTNSTLVRGRETNIGLTYRLLSEVGPSANLTIYYEPGIQWRGWRHTHEVLAGIGINRMIRRAYLFLARNYRPGDRIIMMGFSRGAYAIRSLGGLIDTMGLLRPAQIRQETLDRVYDLYRTDPQGTQAQALKSSLCHAEVPIAFMGVYDTVRALGVRWPLLWRFSGTPHPYHNHALGPSVRIGRHALAMHETREAFAPVLWQVPPERVGPVIQMWFRGTHGDIGGHLNGWNQARPLSNISLVWMLGEAEAAGLPLPLYWRNRFLTDPKAPSVGSLQGWAKLFFARRRRKIGIDPSERIHPTARAAAERAGLRLPIGAPPAPGE